MKKFILKVACFFAIIVVIDLIAGVVFPYLVANAKGGDNGRNNYICFKTNEDVLIFGSSRAAHHYNPQIITDSTGMTCHNCGQDGNGIILSYGRLLMIEKRYSPKVIIYDVQSTFDLSAYEDNHKYIVWLKPYYNNDEIKAILNDVDKTEKYKMMSNMYRYNSKFLQIINDCINPLRSMGKNGYKPYNEKMDTMKIIKDFKLKEDTLLLDPIKTDYIRRFISLANKSKIVFVGSPMWYGGNESNFNFIRDVCNENNIPFYDFSNDKKYVHKNMYFKDGVHMNGTGADEFSKDLIMLMKRDNVI